MIFKDEVRNVDELVAKLIDSDSLKKIKVAVVCFIFNKQGQVILNRRGPGARDDVGKLQAVGGSVNKSDADFLSALKRENILKRYKDKIIKVRNLPLIDDKSVVLASNFKDLLSIQKETNKPINYLDIKNRYEATFVIMVENVSYVYKLK